MYIYIMHVYLCIHTWFFLLNVYSILILMTNCVELNINTSPWPGLPQHSACSPDSSAPASLRRDPEIGGPRPRGFAPKAEPVN